MKKTVLIICMVFTGSVLFAQSPFTFGPKAGINFASISTEEPSFDNKTVIGYQGGAFVRISLGNLYVQPELVYVHKGGELFNENDQQYQSKKSEYFIAIDQMEIPIMGGFKLIDWDEFNLRVMAGPTIAFNVSKELDIKVDGEEPLDVNKYYSADDLKGGTWGLNIGAGIDYHAFTFDIRYDMGISSVSSEYIFEKLNTFNISVGFKIL